MISARNQAGQDFQAPPGDEVSRETKFLAGVQAQVVVRCAQEVCAQARSQEPECFLVAVCQGSVI